MCKLACVNIYVSEYIDKYMYFISITVILISGERLELNTQIDAMIYCFQCWATLSTCIYASTGERHWCEWMNRPRARNIWAGQLGQCVNLWCKHRVSSGAGGDEALRPITAARLGSDAQRPDAAAAAAEEKKKEEEEEEVWRLLVNYNWDTKPQWTRGVFTAARFSH